MSKAVQQQRTYDSSGRLLNYVELSESRVIYQTHCLYDNWGQVIVVEYKPGSKVAQFCDVSRGVSGVVDMTESEGHTVPAFVESAYLHYRYHERIDYRLDDELKQVGVANRHLVPCRRPW